MMHKISEMIELPKTVKLFLKLGILLTLSPDDIEELI